MLKFGDSAADALLSLVQLMGEVLTCLLQDHLVAEVLLLEFSRWLPKVIFYVSLLRQLPYHLVVGSDRLHAENLVRGAPIYDSLTLVIFDESAMMVVKDGVTAGQLKRIVGATHHGWIPTMAQTGLAWQDHTAAILRFFVIPLNVHFSRSKTILLLKATPAYFPIHTRHHTVPHTYNA